MKESLIYRTGQAWKFWFQVCGGLIGAVICIVAFLQGDLGLPDSYMPLLYAGLLVSTPSIVFACISIKCPSCGTKWFWLAVSKKHKEGWFDWLFSMHSCPVCGADEKGNKNIEQ